MSLARTSPEALDHIEATGGYELPAVQILPTAVLPKSEFPIVAEQIVGRFRDLTDNLTAFVLVKQATAIMKQAEDRLKEKAITTMRGQKQNVLSAEVSTRRLVAYLYNDTEMDDWMKQIGELEKKVEARKTALRSGEKVVNGYGEICTAELVKDGVTIAVEFK